MPVNLASDDPLLLRDRLLLPLSFDPAQLARDLDAMPDEAWVSHFVAQNYEGDWSVLPLRCKAGVTHPVMMAYADPAATEFEETPWLQRAPYLRHVLGQFRCSMETARLMKLTPGSVIKPHSDHALSVSDGTVRLHIPVRTNAEVDFRLNNRRIVMEPGSCWFLRLSDVHSIINAGSEDRVHLVFDLVVDEWVIGLLRSGHCPESS